MWLGLATTREAVVETDKHSDTKVETWLICFRSFKVVNVVEQVVEEVHVVPETQQSEADPNSDQQEPAETQPLPSSSSPSSLPSPSSPPPQQVEAEIPKVSPSPDHIAADDASPPPAEPSSDIYIDPNTNADVSADSGNAPEPASPTSHASLESASRWVLPHAESEEQMGTGIIYQ